MGNHENTGANEINIHYDADCAGLCSFADLHGEDAAERVRQDLYAAYPTGLVPIDVIKAKMAEVGGAITSILMEYHIAALECEIKADPHTDDSEE